MTFCRVVTVLWSWHYRLELDVDGSLIVINTSVGEIIKINTIVVNSAASEISMERERESGVYTVMNHLVYWVY